MSGTVKETAAAELPRMALTEVGASGTVAGVTEFDAADAVLVPTEFVAVTVKVYGVPLLKPVIVIGEAPPEAVKLPTLEVTV